MCITHSLIFRSCNCIYHEKHKVDETIVLFASTITHNAIIILIWIGVPSPLAHIIFNMKYNINRESKFLFHWKLIYHQILWMIIIRIENVK